MRLWLGALLLLSTAVPGRARPPQALLSQPSELERHQSKLLAEIAQWRSDYLYNPRGDARMGALSAELKTVENLAATAADESRLAAARRRLEAWVRQLLAGPYAEAKARGMKGESYAQFIVDRSRTNEYYADMRSELDLGLRAVARLRQLYLRSPDAVFEGGSSATPGAPLPRARPVVCPPSRLRPHPAVPARYAKVRAQLVKEGADPLVVDNVIHHALVQKLDPLLFLALIKKESHFRPNTVSKAGARGLGQVMPATGRGLGVRDECKLQDIETNLHAASRYFVGLWKQFVGPEAGRVARLSRAARKKADLALSAYNAGPTAVTRHGGVPPYPETQDYVQKIWTYYRQLKKLAP